MGQGISAILTFAIGVAISPVPIIAVILMLFSARARVNGPAFLVGWVLSLAVVSTVIYMRCRTTATWRPAVRRRTRCRGARSSSASLLLALARRNWRKRPGPGGSRRCPSGSPPLSRFSPVKAFGLAVVLAAVNPKNLILTVGAAAGLAQVPGCRPPTQWYRS